MSYNAFSRPRFYTNSVEHLYNKGNITSIDPVFLSSSWHSPKTYTLEPSTTTSGYGYIKGFKVNLNKSSLLYDFNYIMILGHNLHSTNSKIRCLFKQNGVNTSVNSLRGYDLINSSNIEHGSWNTSPEGWTKPSYDYVPIIIEVEPITQPIDEINVIIFNPQNHDIKISGISFGNYYDLPYNPDLGIKKSISYDNVNTYDTAGGKTMSSNFGSSKPFNPFVNVYSTDQTLYDEQTPQNGVCTWTDTTTGESGEYDMNEGNCYDMLASEGMEGYFTDTTSQPVASQDYIPSGRRSYDISYSYIGSSSGGQNHLMPRDFNYYRDMNNSAYDDTYDSAKNNLYTSVINKTMGTHIPFIFSLNGSNPNELMLSRFKDNNFSFDEVAPNVHNVSFGIREVW